MASPVMRLPDTVPGPRHPQFQHQSQPLLPCPSSNELGCSVSVSWNGTGLEARNKWGQGMWVLPSCWGSDLSVSRVVLPPLQAVMGSVAERCSWEVFLTKMGWRQTLHKCTLSGYEGLWQESCSQCRKTERGGGKGGAGKLKVILFIINRTYSWWEITDLKTISNQVNIFHFFLIFLVLMVVRFLSKEWIGLP